MLINVIHLKSVLFCLSFVEFISLPVLTCEANGPFLHMAACSLFHTIKAEDCVQHCILLILHFPKSSDLIDVKSFDHPMI